MTNTRIAEQAVKRLIKVGKSKHEKDKKMMNKKMKFIKEVMEITERDNVKNKGIKYWQNKYVDLENIVMEYVKNGVEDLKMPKKSEEDDIYKYIMEMDDCLIV